jgi:hypothetical protein
MIVSNTVKGLVKKDFSFKNRPMAVLILPLKVSWEINCLKGIGEHSCLNQVRFANSTTGLFLETIDLLSFMGTPIIDIN